MYCDFEISIIIYYSRRFMKIKIYLWIKYIYSMYNKYKSFFSGVIEVYLRIVSFDRIRY